MAPVEFFIVHRGSKQRHIPINPINGAKGLLTLGALACAATEFFMPLFANGNPPSVILYDFRMVWNYHK